MAESLMVETAPQGKVEVREGDLVDWYAGGVRRTGKVVFVNAGSGNGHHFRIEPVTSEAPYDLTGERIRWISREAVLMVYTRQGLRKDWING